MADLDSTLIFIWTYYLVILHVNLISAVYISEPNLNQENDLMNTTSLNQKPFLKSDYNVRQDAISARRDIFPVKWPAYFGRTSVSRQIRSDPYFISAPRSNIDPVAVEVTQKQAELQQLLQQLYQAEADVQMQAGEVTRIQQSAAEAIQQLEDATNKARMLSSDLQAAQDEASSAAMRAHTAQLQLAAHDHLMFAARQRVDSLSAQMLSAQAELATVQQVFTLNATTHHLEDQGKISVAFNIPPYGQVFTNSSQLAPEPNNFGPESLTALTNFEAPNSLKSSGSEITPLSNLNVSPDYFNPSGGGADDGGNVQRQYYFPRERSMQRLMVDYPNVKQQFSRREAANPQQEPASLKMDPTLQEDSFPLMDELQKQTLDPSASVQP